MARGTSSGKRPQAKLKAMAKLGENLYKTTKIYRYLHGRDAAVPKPKWGQFLQNTREEHSAWQTWWNSPQSDRWKARKPSQEEGQ